MKIPSMSTSRLSRVSKHTIDIHILCLYIDIYMCYVHNK